MKKFLPYLILIVMAVVVIVIKKYKGASPGSGSNTKAATTKQGRGLDRTLSHIEFTAHAKCRMGCRHISQKDIEEILRDGEIDYTKSEINANPCPVYAVQGYTHDREHLKVIFGQCDSKTKVITCYNLDQDFECHCPGDENKN
jgi:hypothetical protein